MTSVGEKLKAKIAKAIAENRTPITQTRAYKGSKLSNTIKEDYEDITGMLVFYSKAQIFAEYEEELNKDVEPGKEIDMKKFFETYNRLHKERNPTAVKSRDPATKYSSMLKSLLTREATTHLMTKHEIFNPDKKAKEELRKTPEYLDYLKSEELASRVVNDWENLVKMEGNGFPPKPTIEMITSRNYALPKVEEDKTDKKQPAKTK
jgi:hypothetical protein